jgi:hypothetical protein
MPYMMKQLLAGLLAPKYKQIFFTELVSFYRFPGQPAHFFRVVFMLIIHRSREVKTTAGACGGRRLTNQAISPLNTSRSVAFKIW